ncbi:hypothetical protein MJL69_25635, partial [Salmonella enterica subsp. enterica serovar Lubbock]|nr:hypothetical protein [Salmonella enterica subsp. enterica serovar Lubbock]MDI8948749.1 hypothetical protein [Salmonella enterica subsp. enterica serovar Lubbock]MDI8987636.1 hypothetical protein [Salmonella enterica subsp. enterica serovar Lubbock]
KETLATIQYSEDLTPELTLEGYNQRAKEHAEKMVSKIFEAAQKQAALFRLDNGHVYINPVKINFSVQE